MARARGAAPSEEPVPRGWSAAGTERLLALLKDPARSAFHLVALAEPVAEAQTRMLFTQLRERGDPGGRGRGQPGGGPQGCPACLGRRGLQAPHVRKYQALDKAVPVHLVAKREVGRRASRAQALRQGVGGRQGDEGAGVRRRRGPAGAGARPVDAAHRRAAAAAHPAHLLRGPGRGGEELLRRRRGGDAHGEGGAGAPHLHGSGALAVGRAAEPAHRHRDPGEGHQGPLRARAGRAGWFNALRKRWKEKAEKAFEAFGKPGGRATDRELLRNLLDVAPAGIDELAAMSVLTDALVQERFKRIVVDPAPRGPRRARGGAARDSPGPG